MILIFSQQSDQSVNDVVQLLLAFGQAFIRINEGTRVEFKINAFNKVDSYFIVDGNKIEYSNISSIWVRKGAFFKELRDSQVDSFEVAEFILNEERAFYSVLDSLMEGLRQLNSFEHVQFNKNRALQVASDFGIRVPVSIVLNSSNILKNIVREMGVITKPLYNIIDPKSNLSMLTRQITMDDIKLLPAYFYPSLIQKHIKTIYEIRTVYLLGKLYSCVLVPRYKAPELPDYRGSRFADLGLEPIRLKESFQEKVKTLMYRLGLNFCSLDILVDDKEEYYLIDINPFGQYGMVSTRYNGIIDYEIAKYLSNE